MPISGEPPAAVYFAFMMLDYIIRLYKENKPYSKHTIIYTNIADITVLKTQTIKEITKTLKFIYDHNTTEFT
jgi:hypothetical protein